MADELEAALEFVQDEKRAEEYPAAAEWALSTLAAAVRELRKRPEFIVNSIDKDVLLEAIDARSKAEAALAEMRDENVRLRKELDRAHRLGAG